MMTRLTLLTALLLLAACAQPSTQTPYFDQGELAQEAAVQKEYAERGEAIQKTPFTPAELQAMEQRLAGMATRITKAGQDLCEAMGRDPTTCTYSMKMSTDDQKNLNAYANGTEIFVTPVMMRFADDDNELAAVLSHEYAHNIMGHVDAKKRNAMAGYAVGALADMLASSQGFATGGALGKAGLDQGIRAFSPDFEREADYVGMYVMARAGYDIEKAPALWRNMTAADPDGAFMTGSHPSNPERYVLLDRTKREIVEKFQRREILVPNAAPKRG